VIIVIAFPVICVVLVANVVLDFLEPCVIGDPITTAGLLCKLLFLFMEIGEPGCVAVVCVIASADIFVMCGVPI
jgi:hypothetical protein